MDLNELASTTAPDRWWAKATAKKKTPHFRKESCSKPKSHSGQESVAKFWTAEMANAGSLQTTWPFCESGWLWLTAVVLPCSTRTSVECLGLPISDHSWRWCESRPIWLTSRRKIVPGCQIYNGLLALYDLEEWSTLTKLVLHSPSMDMSN